MVALSRATFTVLCAIALARPVMPAALERSISTSRQFLVFGSNVRLRGAICELAEETKRDFLQLIDQRDEWATPIVVNAQYPQANLPEAPRAHLNFAQTGFGLKLQLDLILDLDVNQLEVRRELLRAILLEFRYRRETNLPAGTPYVPPPSWLLDGVLRPPSDFERAKLIDILRAPVIARKIPLLKEFLRPQEVSDLDAPGRVLYRAYSWALVALLTETPAGRVRLAGFIADLSLASDPMVDLGSHFPELSNASGAERLWSESIERLVTGQHFRLLGWEETEQRLDLLLVLRTSKAGVESKYRLDEFPRFIRNGSTKLILSRCSRDLIAFASHANPIYRPIVCEYAKIGMLLARGKTKGVANQLARLRVSRRGIAVQGERINDYLNWFEATKSQEPSGAFTDYLRTSESVSWPGQRRRDPISVYLDVLETQFQN